MQPPLQTFKIKHLVCVSGVCSAVLPSARGKETESVFESDLSKHLFQISPRHLSLTKVPERLRVSVRDTVGLFEDLLLMSHWSELPRLRNRVPQLGLCDWKHSPSVWCHFVLSFSSPWLEKNKSIFIRLLKINVYLCVYHVSYWIWMRSLQRHKPAWYISVTVPGCDCRNILCNNSAPVRTGKWPFGCWALIFYFSSSANHPDGRKKESKRFFRRVC